MGKMDIKRTIIFMFKYYFYLMDKVMDKVFYFYKNNVLNITINKFIYFKICRKNSIINNND